MPIGSLFLLGVEEQWHEHFIPGFLELICLLVHLDTITGIIVYMSIFLNSVTGDVLPCHFDLNNSVNAD